MYLEFYLLIFIQHLAFLIYHKMSFSWVETIAGKEVWLVWKLALKQGGELWLKQLAKAAKHLRNDSGGWSFSKLEELFGNPLKILRVYVEREEKKRLTEIYIELCPIRIWKVFDNIFSEYAALISKEGVLQNEKHFIVFWHETIWLLFVRNNLCISAIDKFHQASISSKSGTRGFFSWRALRHIQIII